MSVRKTGRQGQTGLGGRLKECRTSQMFGKQLKLFNARTWNKLAKSSRGSSKVTTGSRRRR